jgi:hypothetical protein
MALLNVRLGLWLANPRRWRAASWWRTQNYWHPVLTYGLLGRGYRRESHFVELTDGGHFENLGIYELARRKMNVILVFDGEADKESSFAAFVSAIRRIKEDFEAQIDPGTGPERVFASTPIGYPKGVMGTDWPYFVAPIRYKDGTTGYIIYIKAAMIRNLSFVAKGYRAKNPDFPHQTTADQFFEPEQFEAYRELGYLSVFKAISDLDLANAINDPNKIWENYENIVARYAQTSTASVVQPAAELQKTT